MAVKLYPHQEKAVENLGNGKVLVGGVGTGKTITSLVYFFTKIMGGTLGDLSSVKTPKDIYVFTTARKRDSLDWQRDAAQLGISLERDASVGSIRLVVDSWNNVEKYLDVEGAFIIFDEQRVVGAGKWAKTFIKLAKQNEWILLSATPGDKWEDYIPLFIANGFVKNRTEFKRNHIVYSAFTKYPKVERYIQVGTLLRWRNWLLVEMPYARHTKRHIHTVAVEHDKELMQKVIKDRWNVFTDEPLRDVSDMFAVMRRLTYTHISRRDAVLTLLAEHPRLIIFYSFDYELELLRTIAEKRPELAMAEWNGHKHQDVPTTDSWVYLVQYAAGAEAWNCTSTDAMCFYSLTYSYRNFEQAQGRIDRLDTPYLDLNYHVLMSGSGVDKAVAKAISAKKSFNESDFFHETPDFGEER